MRNLTSIESSTRILADLRFHLRASDQSTTWLFERNNIISQDDMVWEIDFAGGFAKPVNYNITLATSMGFITENFNKFVKAKAFLQVFVNSDDFTPHYGLVRDITRFASNPNQIKFTIFDVLFDANPKIPLTSFSQYSTISEVYNDNFGLPLYYGKHIRPFYLLPREEDFSKLWGPENISSINHVCSLYYAVNHINSEYLFFSYRYWTGNIIYCHSYSGADGRFYPFEVHEIDPGNPVSLAIKPPTNIDIPDSSVTDGYYNTVIDRVYYWENNRDKVNTICPTNGANDGWNKTNEISISKPIEKVTQLYLTFIVDSYNVNSLYTDVKITTDNDYYKLFSGRSAYAYIVNIFPNSSNSLGGLGGYYPELPLTLSGQNWDFLEQNKQGLICFNVRNAGLVGGETDSPLTAVTCIDIYFQLQISNYKNYSIFGTPVSCSDIAVSENPIGILNDLFDQTSVNYVTSIASQVMIETSSYNLQCLFDKQQDLVNIINDFGKLCGIYTWMGDSGYINYRSYQESADVTINYTLTTCDIIRDSMEIIDNPLATSAYDTKKYSEIRVNYAYHHGKNLYENTITVDRYNNAHCNSVYAAGIQDKAEFKTKYIMESDTASLYLQNIVRKHTQNEQIVRMNLPPRFFSMELGDVFQLDHPALLQGSSIYQITKINANYVSGTLKIEAHELQNL